MVGGMSEAQSLNLRLSSHLLNGEKQWSPFLVQEKKVRQRMSWKDESALHPYDVESGCTKLHNISQG